MSPTPHKLTIGGRHTRLQGRCAMMIVKSFTAPDLKIFTTTCHGFESEDGITVDLGTGEDLEATLVGTDPSTDLAVLKVDSKYGTPAPLRELAGAKVGNLVLRLGRPGKTVRVTSGIISAFGTEPWRTHGGTEIERYFETDASHPFGFSGGLLVTLNAEVFGLNTGGLRWGVSLTIPTATVRKVVDSLLAHGKIRRGYLGLSSQPVRLPENVQQAIGEELGLLVLAVEPGGPADKAGILFGDTVLRLGGDEVCDFGDLQAFLRADHVGETVLVKILRSGAVKDLTIIIAQRP